MTTENNNSVRRKKIIIFSLLLLATIGIASYLVATLWQKEDIIATVQPHYSEHPTVAVPVNYNVLISQNELLSNRLHTMQSLDQQYATILTESNDKKKLDSVNQQIHIQEEIFHASIDSIVLNTPNQKDSGLNALTADITNSYRSIWESRNAISSLRNAISLNKNGMQPDASAMLKLQNELQEKNNRVATLESSLKALNSTKTAASPQQQPTTGDLAVLKENIASQANNINTLTATNNNLKQENDRLKQQAEASKQPSAAESSLKNKAASLQQRVDELNAELRLAQVDCNLSRVDAAQIISNSRQRKELLSEASGILTTLAKSDDAEVRKKVQDKIARLNKVAANTRD